MHSFNDESVVRAVFKSKIPIISGIGHEGDCTLSDFVSDYRSSTPTAAAEKSLYDLNDLIQYLDLKNKKFHLLLNNKICFLKTKINLIKNSTGFLNFNYKIKYYN